MIAWSVKDSGVIHQEFDGEVIVIDLASGTYFSLPGSGGVLWRRLASQPVTVESLVAGLVAMHEVDTATAERDVSGFLADLEREGLVVRTERAEANAPHSDAGPTRTAYAAPKVNAYRDLQELFLLDPVHDVDPAVGWPHAGGGAGSAPPAVPATQGVPVPATAPRTDAVLHDVRSTMTCARLAAADLVWASAEDTTVVVNRDRGLYCRLDGEAACVWRALEAGPVQISAGALADALFNGGFIEPTGTSGSGPSMGAEGGSFSIHADLVEQIRPWGNRKRPPRAPARDVTSGLCDRLDAWFESAVRTSRTSEHSIAGHRIRVETDPDGDCASLARALPDASAPTGDGHRLLIRAWRGSAAQPAPLLGNLIESLRARWGTLCGPRGEVIDLHTETTSAIFDPGTCVLSVIDRTRSRAWAVKADERTFPFWEIGSPFRFVLHDFFSHRGLQFVHGAAIGDARRALLVVGIGGSGKSSTAMACAAAGMSYLGDDYCLVDCESRQVHCLYRSGKLVGASDLVRLPAFAGRSINADSFEHGGSGKGVYLVDAAIPGSIAATRPVAGIAIPQVVRQERSHAGSAHAGDALEAILPSTVGQIPGSDSRDAQRLARLASACPAMKITVGSDARGIADAVQRALDACSPSA